MDTLFLETCEFRLPFVVVQRCRIQPSQEEVLRELMAAVGVELIDYGSFTVRPSMPPRDRDLNESWDLVSAYSKAYRERAERAAARR